MLTTGHTEIIVMAGQPIRQARSPELFNQWFRDHGLDRIMVPMEVAPDVLPDLFRLVRNAGNCRGVVLTAPLKQSAATLVDQVGAQGEFLGSVNTVRRNADGSLIADMMDGPGFWNGASELDFEPSGKSIFLIGSGAAAAAIAHGFAALDGAELYLCGTDKNQMQQLSGSLSSTGLRVRRGVPDELSSFDLIINATPVGMTHCPGLPIDEALFKTLPQHAIAADLVTDPVETDFLKTARAHGLKTMRGELMTRGQFQMIGTFLGVL